ncbi:MAG: hypothetical protein ACOCT0_06115 [Halobacteriota archaeon]
MKRRKVIRYAGGAVAAGAVSGCLHGEPGDDENSTDGNGDQDTPEDTALVDTSFDVDGAFDGVHRRDATVEFDGSSVWVEGAVAGANGCYTAELDGAEYVEDENTLVVDVTPVEDRDEGEECTDEPVAVEYSFSAEFQGALPSVVEVRHGDRTAVRAERGTHLDVDGGVEHSEFGVLRVENAEEEDGDAEIEFQQGIVEVNGSIIGSDGCKTAALDAVEYDASEDEVSLDVVTQDRDDAGSCTQALVEIWYRARVYFEAGAPDDVSVTHDGEESFGESRRSDSASQPE